MEELFRQAAPKGAHCILLVWEETGQGLKTLENSIRTSSSFLFRTANLRGGEALMVPLPSQELWKMTTTIGKATISNA